MTQRPPPNRRPSPPPAVPPPLPPAAQRMGELPPGQPFGAGDAVPVIVTTRRGGSRDSGGTRPEVGGPAIDWRLLVAGVLVGGLTVAGLFMIVGSGGTAREAEPKPVLPAQPGPQARASDPGPRDSGPRDSGGTIARVEQPVARAEPSNPMPTPAPAGPSPEELAAEAARKKAEADIKEQEVRTNARLQAFRDLKAMLEQAGHLPLEADVNLESQEEQTISLCTLGTAEVGVALPERLAFKVEPDKPDWKLEHVGEPEGPWRITVTDTAQTHEIAKVEVREEGEKRMLSLRLLEMPAAKDPVWVAGRQALTTAPLVLRPPREKAVELETFVQLCTPKRIEPLRFEKLLTDKRWLPSGKTPGEPLEAPSLPNTPWPCRVELEGRGADGITATVTGKPRQPRMISPQQQLEPLLLTATWTWSGEQEQPFMSTTFALQDRGSTPGDTASGAGGDGFQIRVVRSEVLPPWNGWRRLVDLKEAGAAPPPPLAQLPPTPPSFFKQGVPTANDIPIGIFAAYSDIARQYVPRLTHKEVQSWLASAAAQTVTVGLDDWRQIVRARLRTTKGFGNWVRRVAPPPPPDESSYENGVYIPMSERTARQEKYAKYAEAGPEVVEEYWDSLKADASRRGAEREEVILCCLHFEVESVLNDKRKTKQLLEAVGDGTVELTGRVWSVVGSSEKHRVLLAELGSPEIRAASVPLMTSPPQKIR